MALPKNVIDCYDKTAKNYAKKFLNELEHKHLDRILLKAFAEENKTKGKLIDFGCGPGQTTNFLFETGVNDLIGTDISPKMISEAKKINPAIKFEVADMLNLNYENSTFGSAIAFYAIVHFTMEQLLKAFMEINRILIPGGQFLFSFHVGTGTIHHDVFLDEKVNIDFYFFETEKVIDLLKNNGFAIIDVIERQPYKDVEYPSKRAYVWVSKK